MVLYLQYHFLGQNFFASQLFVSKLFVHLFLIAKKQHTFEINVQNFLSQKNACISKSSKIFDYLVRVHSDTALELFGREGTGE